MPIQTIRNSERRDFLRCPQRWSWAWDQGLRSRKGGKLHFWFGTGIHEALAEWYIPGVERGPDPRETWRDYCERERWNLVREEAQDDEHFYEEIVELGNEMFRGYLNTYGDDPDWEVLVPERSFAVVVKRPDGIKIRVVGTFDLLYRSRKTGKLYVGEHKTAKVIRTGHLQTDNQAGVYHSVAAAVAREEGYIGKKDKLEGITYNYLRKAKVDPAAVYDAEGWLLKDPEKKHYASALVTLPDYEDVGVDKLVSKYKKDELAALAREYGMRVVGDRAATQPASFFYRQDITRTARERKQTLVRVGQEAQWMEAARSGTLPLLKNFTTDCEWDCDFYQMCQLHEKGDDWEQFQVAVFSVTDPYKDHRKAA